MLLMGSSAHSPATSMVAMGGDEHIPGHPSLPALAVELAAGSQGAHFQRGGHQKDPKSEQNRPLLLVLRFWC